MHLLIHNQVAEELGAAGVSGTAVRRWRGRGGGRLGLSGSLWICPLCDVGGRELANWRPGGKNLFINASASRSPCSNTLPHLSLYLPAPPSPNTGPQNTLKVQLGTREKRKGERGKERRRRWRKKKGERERERKKG